MSSSPMTHFTSDTHFDHKSICKFTDRPFADTEEMNAALIANWNAVVGPRDTVWHLGDFSFGNEAAIHATLAKLNGRKRLILGNHDRLIRKRPHRFIAPELFLSVADYAEVKHAGWRICLSHYGHRVWNGSHRGSILLYGHSHGTLPPYGKSVDVGVDSADITEEYRPVSINEVIAWAETRDVCIADYHGRDVVGVLDHA